MVKKPTTDIEKRTFDKCVRILYVTITMVVRDVGNRVIEVQFARSLPSFFIVIVIEINNNNVDNNIFLKKQL